MWRCKVAQDERSSCPADDLVWLEPIIVYGAELDATADIIVVSWLGLNPDVRSLPGSSSYFLFSHKLRLDRLIFYSRATPWLLLKLRKKRKAA